MASSLGRYLVVVDRAGRCLFLKSYSLSGAVWVGGVSQAARFNDATAAAMASARIRSEGKMSVRLVGSR